ncbi:hypothetical protein ES703_56331 [subsurface metagenome]
MEDERRNCPLGILYVAGSLEKAGYKVEIIDLREQPRDKWDNIPLSDIYGITSSSADFPYAKEVADFLRARQDCWVIIGGPHSLALDECLNNGFSVVVGEGEIAILDMLENNLRTSQSPLIKNMDNIPFPARHLLPKESVVSTTLCHQGVPATTIISSRGCPFNCTYCASPRLWRKVRRHSPEYVITEVGSLVRDYGIKEIRFQDDELNLSKDWLERIAPISTMVKFRCNARAEVGNWKYLKQAGCYEVGIGVETAHPLAHEIHKGTPLDKTRRGIWQAYQAGLEVRLFFIIGLPYDHGNISDRTIRFLEAMPPLVGVHLNIFSPFPGSAIGDNPEKFGVRVLENPVSILSQEGKPHFTYKLQGVNNLERHYERIRNYIGEKRWVLP